MLSRRYFSNNLLYIYCKPILHGSPRPAWCVECSCNTVGSNHQHGFPHLADDMIYLIVHTYSWFWTPHTLTYSYMRSLHSIRPCQFNRINWLNLFSGAGYATTRSRQCDHIFMEKSVAYCIMAIFMVATLIFVCRVVIVALSLSRSKTIAACPALLIYGVY